MLHNYKLTIFSSILSEYDADNYESDEDNDEPTDDVRDISENMHKEVLLSYRLLFGHDDASKRWLGEHRSDSLMPKFKFLEALTEPLMPTSVDVHKFPSSFWPETARAEDNKLRTQQYYSGSEFAILGLGFASCRVIVKNEIHERLQR